MASHVTLANTGKRMKDGHQVTPATTYIGRVPKSVRASIQICHRTRLPTSWVSSSIRSRTSPTACSLSADSGWRSAARSRSSRSRPSARSERPTQAIFPQVSTTAAPTRQIASNQTRERVGFSASRPATTVPSVIPTAPTAEAASAANATGLFNLRASILRDASTAGGAGRSRSGVAVSVVIAVMVRPRYADRRSFSPGFRRSSAAARTKSDIPTADPLHVWRPDLPKQLHERPAVCPRGGRVIPPIRTRSIIRSAPTARGVPNPSHLPRRFLPNAFSCKVSGALGSQDG